MQLSICCFCAVLMFFKSGVSVSYSPLVSLTFSNQLRGLIFLVLDARAEVPSICRKVLIPQGGSHGPGYPFPLVGLPSGVHVLSR